MFGSCSVDFAQRKDLITGSTNGGQAQNQSRDFGAVVKTMEHILMNVLLCSFREGMVCLHGDAGVKWLCEFDLAV